MDLELLCPEERTVSAEALLVACRSAAAPAPFAPATLEFCGRFSQAILQDDEARRYPELVALGFFMRPAELTRLRQQFEALSGDGVLLVPRGLCFHIPPANVDTMFVYSWLLAALTGNKNLIRLSRRRTPQIDALLRLLRRTLAESPADTRSPTWIVTYGHEAEPTALLSQACDVRIVWGGDETVATLRRSPLPPRARELTFPDRYSLSAIDVAAYLALDDAGRQQLAAAFFNDAFWFDQRGCSSPRLLVWRGERAGAERASAAFFDGLAAEVHAKGYALAPAARIEKLSFSCGAIIDLPVDAYRGTDDVVVLRLSSLEGFRRDHCGGGLFFEVRVDALAELAPFLEARDQTLGCFGIPAAELRGFARSLNGRALDRIVPIGQALQFHRYWDGLDLLREFCRVVHVAVKDG